MADRLKITDSYLERTAIFEGENIDYSLCSYGISAFMLIPQKRSFKLFSKEPLSLYKLLDIH